MTLVDLKSWWKQYSPIIKEAKKRNNVSLLNNYVNVYRRMISLVRENSLTSDELKDLKIIQRGLDETMLDVVQEQKNVRDHTHRGTIGQPRDTTDGLGVNVVQSPKDEGSFVERIRARYSEGGKGEGVRENGEEEEDQEIGSEGIQAGGVNFENTLEEGDEGGRDVIDTTSHFSTHLDTLKNNSLAHKNDLDTLQHLIYKVEKFIESDG